MKQLNQISAIGNNIDVRKLFDIEGITEFSISTIRNRHDLVLFLEGIEKNKRSNFGYFKSGNNVCITCIYNSECENTPEITGIVTLDLIVSQDRSLIVVRKSDTTQITTNIVFSNLYIDIIFCYIGRALKTRNTNVYSRIFNNACLISILEEKSKFPIGSGCVENNYFKLSESLNHGGILMINAEIINAEKTISFTFDSEGNNSTLINGQFALNGSKTRELMEVPILHAIRSIHKR